MLRMTIDLTYQNALTLSIVAATPESIRDLFDIATAEGVGVHAAVSHRTGLRAALDRPTDQQLAESEQRVTAASDNLGNARRALDDAQRELDQAEAEAARAKQAALELRSDRIAADRALTDPTVAAAFASLEHEKS